MYSFSRDACAENARKMVDDYLGALRELEDSKSPDLTVDEVARRHSSNLRWDRELKNNLRRRKAMAYASDKVWTTQSRPFVKQRCYAEYNKKKRPVISLFSGAMGLDLGLEAACLDIAVALECNPCPVATIVRNRPLLPLIDRPIEDVSSDDILETAQLEPGESFAVVGGPSCQVFSTAGQRQSLGDPRSTMFTHFVRVVRGS